MAVRRARPADGDVTREEFTELAAFVDECARNVELQFKRIAQMQAELDLVRSAWAKPERRRQPSAKR